MVDYIDRPLTPAERTRLEAVTREGYGSAPSLPEQAWRWAMRLWLGAVGVVLGIFGVAVLVQAPRTAQPGWAVVLGVMVLAAGVAMVWQQVAQIRLDLLLRRLDRTRRREAAAALATGTLEVERYHATRAVVIRHAKGEVYAFALAPQEGQDAAEAAATLLLSDVLVKSAGLGDRWPNTRFEVANGEVACQFGLQGIAVHGEQLTPCLVLGEEDIHLQEADLPELWWVLEGDDFAFVLWEPLASVVARLTGGQRALP